MTRKDAIKVVVEAADGGSWYPADWVMAGVNNFQPSIGKCGRGTAVGFATKVHSKTLAKHGRLKRVDGGWNFTRKWLEKNGHLK